MSPLSAAGRAALYDQETPEIFLTLVTIDHADLVTPIRVVNDSEAVVSGGETFSPFPFRIKLATQGLEQPLGNITIDNIDRSIISSIRTISDPLSVRIEIVLKSSPDTIEVGPWNFEWRAVSYNPLTLDGELVYPDDPERLGKIFSPSTTPGLFG